MAEGDAGCANSYFLLYFDAFDPLHLPEVTEPLLCHPLFHLTNCPSEGYLPHKEEVPGHSS